MDFSHLLQAGAANAWLYLPMALLLGALHGLEPGHSKTMMAAFIVAVRGTVFQAALLGLSAAISHSLVIWLLAALALHFGQQWNVTAVEPYLQVATGVAVTALAIWNWRRTRRDQAGPGEHAHEHHHHDETKTLSGRHGETQLAVFEDGVPPRFRLTPPAAASPTSVSVTTTRPDGTVQVFAMTRREQFWESQESIPEPHEFSAIVNLRHADGEETLFTEFVEHAHHHNLDGEDDDAHARAHASDIRRRFSGRAITTPQIVLFGLTGGLMPCPAAFSILLICLQLKRVVLGFTIVAAFSVGLAITLVSVGVIAAWGAQRMTQASGRLSRIARRAPYFSSVLLILLGVIFIGRGLIQLL
jgi:nickel/cobalt transporter (NicO) family protein